MKNCLKIIVLLSLLALSAGCIRTKVVINTEPPRAKVTFNETYRGRTPIEIPIIFYWYYKINIEKEGYKNTEKIERFYAPPWFAMPFDLIMEIMPFPIYHTYERNYVLEKAD